MTGCECLRMMILLNLMKLLIGSKRVQTCCVMKANMFLFCYRGQIKVDPNTFEAFHLSEKLSAGVKNYAVFINGQ